MIFLVGVILVLGVYYLRLSKTKNLTSDKPSFTILRQEKGDKEGRTAIYSDEGTEFITTDKFLKDSGDKKTGYRMILGIFSRWEKISNSEDRYILLNNAQNNKSMIKVRVIFNDNKDILETKLGIIDILENKVFSIDKNIKELSDQMIQSIFKKGDALLIIPIRDNKESVVLDKQKNIIAKVIIVRREKNSFPKGLKFK